MMNRTRLAIATAILLGLGGALAIASDADLQQYNGSPAWNTDLTAQSTLLPRDGKRVTADSNGPGSAPINRSLKQLKDMLIGMHDGIFGSRSGSQLRTVRALEADGIGGIAESNTDGQIRASAGFEARNNDPHRTSAHFNPTRLRFNKTSETSTNPSPTTPLNNELRAVLIPKVWAVVTTDGAGGSAMTDGANILGTIVGGAVGMKLRIVFGSPMANLTYSVQSTCFVGSTAVPSGALLGDRTTGTVDLTISGHDASAEGMTCDILVMGRQDTP